MALLKIIKRAAPYLFASCGVISIFFTFLCILGAIMLLFPHKLCKKIPLLGSLRKFYKKKWNRFLKLSARGPVWRFSAMLYAKGIACCVRTLRYLYEDRFELRPSQPKTVKVTNITINSAVISWVPRQSSRFNVDKHRLRVRKIRSGSDNLIKMLTDEMLEISTLATARRMVAEKTKETLIKIKEDEKATTAAKATAMAAAMAATAASIATTLAVVAGEALMLATVKTVNKNHKDHTCLPWQTLYDGTDSEYKCTNLEEGCRYEAKVETYNSKGKSSPSKFPLKTKQKAVNNGGHGGGYLWSQANYQWTQTHNEVEVSVSVPPETKKKDIYFEQQVGNFVLILKGTFLIKGMLQKSVSPDSTFWEFEGQGEKRKILVTLQKANSSKWTALLKGDIEVDASMITL